MTKTVNNSRITALTIVNGVERLFILGENGHVCQRLGIQCAVSEIEYNLKAGGDILKYHPRRIYIPVDKIALIGSIDLSGITQEG